MKKSEYQRFSRRLKLPAARSSGQGCIKLRDFSLSSIGWRRGLGRGGAFLLVSPLLGPLPTRSSRGEDGELDFSLSSIGWRRGLGRGGAFLLVSPLLGPLPTRSSRGEDGELDAALGTDRVDRGVP